MDLFEASENIKNQPLAYRMRPSSLDEFIGQDHIAGKGRLLRRLIQADRLSSIILSGPPGTGKTSLARIIANTTKSVFLTLNAVLSGVKQLREATEKAKEQIDLYNRRTILFIDEVHRWNKAQQDALLPWVENGTVILIGATTENPFFEVNSALVSRSRIFQLKALTQDDLFKIAEQAMNNVEKGYGKYRISFADNALEHLIKTAHGDARSLLNALELAVETTPETFPPPDGTIIKINLKTAEESIQKKAVLYDKEGDYHFDTISAFIKSLRGSDPDAALYWLARMVKAGEDPKYIFRRMLILAGEDVGLADPMALVIVQAAAAAFDRVGMPEGRFFLTNAALYLSTAPKSNSSIAFFDALSSVEAEASEEIPVHLKDSNRDKKGFGHGEGYLYPHAYRDHWTAQQYLPEGLKGRVFYNPSNMGYEAKIQTEVQKKREAQLEASMETVQQEILTFSPRNREKDLWLTRLTQGKSIILSNIREKIFSSLSLQRHDRILDINAGSGLLLWEVLRKCPEGGVWGIVSTDTEISSLEHYSSHFLETEKPVLFKTDIFKNQSLPFEEGLKFEAIIGRNIFIKQNKNKGVFLQLYSMLSDTGRLSIAETIPSKAQRLSALIGPDFMSRELYKKFQKAENLVYSGDRNYSTAVDENELISACRKAGFVNTAMEIKEYQDSRFISESILTGWIKTDGRKNSYGKILYAELGAEDFAKVKSVLFKELAGKTVKWKTSVAFISGRKNT